MPDANQHLPNRLTLHAAQTHARLLRMRLLALLPVIVAAVYFTGQQYWLSRNLVNPYQSRDWRDRWITSLVGDIAEPNLVACITTGLIQLLPVFLMASFIALLWERIFATGLNRNLQPGLPLFALIFAALMPPAVSLWHVVLGASFGIVFGRCLFGGDGKSFLNPALLGVAFLQIAYPTALTDHPLWRGINGFSGSNTLTRISDGSIQLTAGFDNAWWDHFLGSTQGLSGTTSTLAILLGALLLIVARTASWRIIVSHLLGTVLLAVYLATLSDAPALYSLPWYWHFVTGSFAFCIVFVATDPASACATPAGRWLQGLIVGALIVVLRVVHPSHPDSVIPALLLGSILAPLIDHCVSEWNIWRRRHGYV